MMYNEPVSHQLKPYAPLTAADLDPSSHPVVHVVAFTLSAKMEEEKLVHLITDVRRHVPGVIELYFGQDKKDTYHGKIDRSGGYNYVLVSRHINSKFLEIYQKHPLHLKLATFLTSHATNKPVALDFVNIPSRL
ncbi:hypothetical protein STCU_11660 [Strigomonas culicis]|uniref:Stress-response A/B barrel domain-containing protein n=1 Tax=Strigomonas culicis TaxID=28005 RepID=S9THX0_9TRYP|nr:hypothetical protein STCU_11660 [Strigomonas culicis]|eukprot:EPY15938.1 hypothetical protein STCU_11660 [Strigomonas culicis]